MRCFLLLVGWCLLFAQAVAAAPLPADTAVLRVTRFPARGLLLDKGWRYQAGDNPAWAQPAFDDSRWDTLSPSQPRRKLPQAVSTGICWLRLRVRLSDSLRQRALVLRAVSAVGAWELYLNGRLVQRSGVLSPTPAQVHPSGTRAQWIDLPNTGSAGLIIAVRFAPGYRSWWLRGEEYGLFYMRMFDAPEARRVDKERAATNTAFCAVGSLLGLLTLLHLAFFRYNPAQRANCYFAFYAGAMSLGAWGFYASDGLPFSSFAWTTAFVASSYVLFGLGGLWAVQALYALFGFRTGRIYQGLWLTCGILLALYSLLVDNSNGILAFFAVMVLATAEQLRLTGRALRLQRRGARIIGVGFGVALLAVLGTIGLSVVNVGADAYWVNILSFILCFLPPALGISLFLAREFALDSQLLQVKLSEVEHLSAQTLAQEQEKQALLAAQNETLEQQVAQRTGELQRSLTDLRATQAQLIQKEKMASLGELTAGIAHEIQNPLNFVNNFSEVSSELVGELQEALAASDTAEAAALAGDLAQNLGKIGHHGRRAAGIVKGMLEHSRTSAGERGPTDLNRLADEYLRLAYQGLRAKDKSFNATLTTDFFAGLPPVNIVGADVGRVLLNLFTNAFYAVRQRQQTGEPGYQPQVGVRTVLLNQQVQIQVIDNGTGMPESVQAKIFQPFFTTKPTGEGTGLGLSLSHDIIAQGHGGTLTVESQEGQGTTFCVGLPLAAVAV